MLTDGGGVVWITCGLCGFISCLDSHSDGTHSCRASMLRHWCRDTFYKPDEEKQTHPNLGWPEDEHILIIGWTIPLIKQTFRPSGSARHKLPQTHSLSLCLSFLWEFEHGTRHTRPLEHVAIGYRTAVWDSFSNATVTHEWLMLHILAPSPHCLYTSSCFHYQLWARSLTRAGLRENQHHGTQMWPWTTKPVIRVSF